MVVAEENGEPVAFLGAEKRKIEMLFVAAERRGGGIGKSFIKYAIENWGADMVTVNEQNPQATGFYERMGFETVARSDTDEQGNAYPILYMRLKK